MRVVAIVISMAVAVYVLRELGAPPPAAAESCREKTGCPAAAPAVAAQTGLPGLRVELYDPTLRDDDETPPPIRIASAEIPWIAAGEAAGPPPPSGRPADVRLAWLAQPGAHGVCVADNSGNRRCVAFIEPQAE